MLTERLLHRMQRPVRLSQSFDRGNLRAFALQSESGAGFSSNTVDMNDASTTLGGITPDMGAGQAQIFAQELHQQGARFYIPGDGFSVHRHGYGRHDLPPNLGAQTPSFRPRA